MASEPDFDPSATVQVEPDEPVEEPVAEEEPTDDVSEFEVSESVAEVAIEQPVVEHEESVVEEEAEADDEPEAAEEPEDQEAELPLPPPVQPVVPPADFDEAPGFEVEAPAAVAEAPPISAEDKSQHEEARRFARLLVSEIKLYNEDAVERGREQNDLYARLKEDIDRSREMYERRIPAEIRTARDYFHEELVRILADGNNDALGM
jgi:hypothetical protein